MACCEDGDPIAPSRESGAVCRIVVGVDLDLRVAVADDELTVINRGRNVRVVPEIDARFHELIFPPEFLR
jgi:hypothetical protein